MTPVRKVNRRSFLKVGLGGAAGLTIGFAIPESARLLAQTTGSRMFPVTGYVHIGTDDTVTLMLAKSEMGQGPMTAVSQMLAEELECDWKRVRTEFAPVDPKLYGALQGTFGSMSIRTGWDPM